MWAWLIGPFIDAWITDAPRAARKRPGAFSPASFRISTKRASGSISEIFDAEAPYTPRGCVAQAWSVAEVLRCWVKTASAEEVGGAIRPSELTENATAP